MSGTFFKHGNLIESTKTTATAGGTTVLVQTSEMNQQFTGSLGQTVQFPNATNLNQGAVFVIMNRSSGTVNAVYDDGSTSLISVSPGFQATVRLINNGTANGIWDVALSSGGGTSSEMVLQALCFTDGTGTPVGCSDPTVVGGKSRITLSSTYTSGVSVGQPNGALIVLINGQKIPRFIDSTLTPNASYTEVSSTIIDLDRDYSGFSYSIEIYQPVAVVDTSTQNTNDLSIIKGSKFRNLIINGNFDYWQRVSSNTKTLSGTSPVAAYTADRWNSSGSISGGINFSLVRVADAPTYTQSGFESKYCLQASSGGTNVPGSSTEYIAPFRYHVEGFEYQSIHGRQATLSFWTRASATGTFSVAFANSSGDRSYVTTFTINAINTWEFKSITITMDTTGTWEQENLLGLRIYINAYGGSAYQTSTLNAWQSSVSNIKITANTASNFWGTSGPAMRIAQVSLVPGPGVGATGFFRAGMSGGHELAMCQRYFEMSYDTTETVGNNNTYNGSIGFNSGGSYADPRVFYSHQNFQVAKRIPPTMTGYSPETGASGKIYVVDEGPSFAAYDGNVAFYFVGDKGFEYGEATHILNTAALHFTADAEF